jgi:hypothetical protein
MVTDNDGATNTASTTATIAEVPNEPPVSDPNGPYSAQVGETITFDGSGSTDPDGSIASYAWAFGDGSTGTGVNPTHAYATAGTFTVSLTVTDNDGATNTASTTATIGDGIIDLDIAQFRVSKRARVDGRPIRITLVVRNDGVVNSAERPATVIGMQGGVEVYNRTLPVSDAVGDGRSRFSFPAYGPPEYEPPTAGEIMWTATIADDDPDVDMATAVTVVR